MIAKRDGELECECDECGETEPGDTLEFKDFIADLKDKEWLIRKEEGQWCHYCPACAGDMLD